MKKNYSKIYATFLILASLTPFSAGAIDPGLATGAATEILKAQANKIIDKAQNSGDYLIFQSAMQAKLLIEYFEKENEKLVDETFDRLDASTQSVLNDTERLLKKLEVDAGDAQEAAEDTVNQASDLVARLPLTDKYPVVTSYGPTIVTPLSLRPTLKVRIKGAGFSYGDPILVIDGTIAKLVGNQSNELTFEVEKPNISFDGSVKTLNATFTAKKPSESWWGWLTGKVVDVEYKLPILVAPSPIGSYKIFVATSEEIEKTQDFSREFHYSSGSASWDCRTTNVGTTVDGRHIRGLHEVREWGESGSQRIASSTPVGFSIEVCAKLINKPLKGYPPGYQHVVYAWQEYWIDHQPGNSEQSGPFTWESDLIIDLPPTTTSFTAEFTGFDGRVTKMIGSDQQSFFDLKYDPSTKRIHLRPTKDKRVLE